jgi:acetyltransferase-like isoleucine patch superfamily enzyme
LSAQVHPTALIEEGVEIGPGTRVWDNVHIRRGARIGRDCIVGEKTYVACDVEIGDLVKINALVYICAGVTIERGVMVSAGTIFTNDRYPRATTPELDALLTSEVTEETLSTRVREGATLGAGCRIGPGLTLGRFTMVGMGTVVTRSVPDFHLVVGNPARSVGVVCRCGHLLLRIEVGCGLDGILACARCERRYDASAGPVRELVAVT